MGNEISNAIESLNSVRNTKFVKCTTKENYIQTYSSDVKLSNGSLISLSISFDKNYAISLPVFHIINPNHSYLHCDIQGKLCILDRDSIMIKPHMLSSLVVECFDRALSILSLDPKSNEYKLEYMREFNSYWVEVAKVLKVYTNIDTSTIKFQKAELLYTNKYLVVSDNKVTTEIIAREYLKIPKKANDKYYPIYLIRLKEGATLPSIKKTYSKKETVKYILSNLSVSSRREFEKLINKISNDFCLMFLFICPSGYHDIAFGFSFHTKTKRKKSVKNSNNCQVEPIYVRRFDTEYLNARLGSVQPINRKKILLLGCGSIGGFVANNLCQTGITTIDILDKDVYTPENACRHFLGFSGIYADKPRYKADLVKNRLYELYPYIEIDSMCFEDRTVESFISSKDRLSNYDLIISALGDPTLNLEINRILYANLIPVPFVCCFNEPYGIGGHVIVVNISHNSCLQCLYTSAFHTDIVQFRGSFVNDGQTFIKNNSGCGGSFVPYGCLDSQQTAILATKVVNEVLLGKFRSNKIYSWLGNSNLLTDSGYSVSDRYLKFSSSNTHIISDNLSGNANCFVCNYER